MLSKQFMICSSAVLAYPRLVLLLTLRRLKRQYSKFVYSYILSIGLTRERSQHPSHDSLSSDYSREALYEGFV
jgi:hypothetical protein